MEPTEATSFLIRSSRISKSQPSLPATRETEGKYRLASRSPFPVSSATASETSRDNSQHTWLYREQRAGTSFLSSNQSSSSTLPPAAASPGKSFFLCSVVHLGKRIWALCEGKLITFTLCSACVNNSRMQICNSAQRGHWFGPMTPLDPAPKTNE